MNVKRKIQGYGGDNTSAKGVGLRIRKMRGFDMTQAEFSRKLGISQSQLSKYEREQLAPTADVLIRFKERFGISIDWLLTGKG